MINPNEFAQKSDDIAQPILDTIHDKEPLIVYGVLFLILNYVKTKIPVPLKNQLESEISKQQYMFNKQMDCKGKEVKDE